MHLFNINRRQFLQGATASLALTTLGASGMDIVYRANPYRVGLIGTGWYGKSDLLRLIQVAPVEVVALCDVDKNMLAAAAKLVSQRQKSGRTPRLYGDYQKMLAENQLDIVLIGTPDHWRALQTIDALKAGAHVYVQKPISVDVMEGEAMVAAARKYGKVAQFQGRFGPIGGGSVPPFFVEARASPVYVVPAGVGCQGVFLPVEGDSVFDAIGVAANDRT